MPRSCCKRWVKVATLVLESLGSNAAHSDFAAIEKGFENPPDSARPRVVALDEWQHDGEGHHGGTWNGCIASELVGYRLLMQPSIHLKLSTVDWYS
jgi:hypothetical protein